MRSKTSNDNYYLLTMAAIAQEIRYRRGERKTDVVLAAGLPLASFGREKKGFREYLFRKEQPLRFRYEDESYEIQIQDVKLFPQGYSALALHPECVRDEPSVLLADIGGWTVDLMRLDNSVPNAATCRSLELGVIRCVDEITEQVRRNTGLSVTDIQIERVLNGQSCSMDPDVYKRQCESRPDTFSRRKYAGRLSATSLATSKKRVPLASANPSLRPAIENAWQGNPAHKRSKSGIRSVSIFLASLQNHSPSVSNSTR